MPAWMSQPPVATSIESRPPRPSNEEIDRQAREIEAEVRNPKRRMSKPLAWYEVWLTALTQPNVDAYDSLRLDPYAMPSRTYLWLVTSGIVSGIFFSLAFSFNPQISESLGALEQQGAPGVGQMIGSMLFCLVPLFGVMYPINTAISIGVMHFVATLMGGKGKYSEFLYLVAAYSSPITIASTFLSIIPFVGTCLGLPINLYSLYLNITAIRSAHDMDALRAFGVIIGTLILNLIVVCLLAYLFISVLASYVPQPTY
jgi:hypothetical protein